MASRKQVTYSSRPSHAARSAHRQGARQFKTYDTSALNSNRRRQQKNTSIIAPIIMLAVAIVLIVLVIGFFQSCSGNAGSAKVADGTPVTVTVDPGEATSSISATLQSAGLIADSAAFTKAVTASGAENSLKPGTYQLTGGMTDAQIIAALEAGPQVDAFSIPEGYTIDKTAEAVAAAYNGSITADQFKSACSNASVYAADYPFLADAGTNSLEGYLFPKTYEKCEGDTAEIVVRRMLTQYQTETASLDYSKAESRGLSKYEVLIMASIVEKESSDDDAIRAQVASVFYNRMEYNDETAGFLQSDATTAYEVKHDPTPEDVATDSPYNTYTRKGLPPTPICSPSLSCLKAACNPADTSYYYFYFADTNGDGITDYMFSENYDDHQSTFANAAA